MENQLPHFALFLFFATLTSVVTRAKGWSNILPLIMVGALIGLTPWSSQSVSPGLAMMFLVAPLVFGDGITSSFRELRKNALNLILLLM